MQLTVFDDRILPSIEMTDIAADAAPALTADEWRNGDRRASARGIDAWARAAQATAKAGGRHPSDDATQYVAKLGVTDDDCVIVMSRAHDHVIVPPPERAALAAFALQGQPSGFTKADVAAVREAAETVASADLAGNRVSAGRAADELRRLAGRIEALLPP